jgi:hypothetical protein
MPAQKQPQYVTDDIISGYLSAADFTDCGPDADEELQGAGWSAEARLAAGRTAQAFMDALTEADGDDMLHVCHTWRSIGHDIWLTRNRHGAGFWDRKEYAENGLGERLTKAAASLGDCEVYCGDDGLLYFTN